MNGEEDSTWTTIDPNLIGLRLWQYCCAPKEPDLLDSFVGMIHSEEMCSDPANQKKKIKKKKKKRKEKT